MQFCSISAIISSVGLHYTCVQPSPFRSLQFMCCFSFSQVVSPSEWQREWMDTYQTPLPVDMEVTSLKWSKICLWLAFYGQNSVVPPSLGFHFRAVIGRSHWNYKKAFFVEEITVEAEWQIFLCACKGKLLHGLIWKSKINCCSHNILIMLLREAFVCLRCLRLALSECIFMHKRWGCLSHLWEQTVSQERELSNCYLKVLPCLRWEGDPCIRGMALTHSLH